MSNEHVLEDRINRAKGMVDAIIDLGSYMESHSVHAEAPDGGMEAIIDFVDDIITTPGPGQEFKLTSKASQKAEEFRSDPGRFSGYMAMMYVFRGIADLKGI